MRTENKLDLGAQASRLHFYCRRDACAPGYFKMAHATGTMKNATGTGKPGEPVNNGR